MGSYHGCQLKIRKKKCLVVCQSHTIIFDQSRIVPKKAYMVNEGLRYTLTYFITFVMDAQAQESFEFVYFHSHEFDELLSRLEGNKKKR